MQKQQKYDEHDKYDSILAESKRTALSHGLFGNTFVVEGGKYVIKAQRIPTTVLRHPDRGKFWVEMSVYKWVDQLSKSEQLMFSRLLAWRVVQPCQNPRRNTEGLSSTRRQEIRRINASPTCVEMLLENKGIPFDDWLHRQMPTSRKLIYSLIGQLAAIHIAMYNGGFFHNDLHFENVLVNESSDKHILIRWGSETALVKIVGGVQLVAIDYGETTRIRKGPRRTIQLLEDIQDSIADLLLKRYEYKNGTELAAKKSTEHGLANKTIFVFPRRVVRGVDVVINEFPEVFEDARAAAIKIDPGYDHIFQRILERKEVHIPGQAASHMARRAVQKIQQELQLVHPKTFAKLFVGSEFYKSSLLDKQDVRKLLTCRTVSELLSLIVR